jgi:hypothetical protein
VSYNGGNGGLKALPSPQERAAERERHEAPLSTQTEHQQMASRNRENFARVNQGRPAIAATARPADFSGRSVIAARAAGGTYHAPTMSPKEARGPAVPANRPFTPANTNNANRNLGGSKPTPQDRTNQGFRPFTPPNSNNSRVTGGSSANPSANKPNEGYRPFNPPNRNNEASGPKNNQPNSPRNNESGPKNNQPNYPRNNEANGPKNNQPNPPRNSQPAPQPHYSQPAPEPRHQTAPPPQPRHESAPPAQPRHESQPKQQSPQRDDKHPGKGR